ncbi:mechanosensitive ion channel family protein [Micromonospora musae]|uniref:mechanosensitive ion channel family protein n=1 Tax=Micromonospora musae TaxID=1894970 RepID=UPI003F4CF282
MRDNVGDAVGDAFRSVMLFVPKAVAFLAILVVGWFVAKAALKIVNRILERVGFDRAVERGGLRRVLDRSRYDASDIVAKLVQYGLLLVTLQLAFGIWGPNPVSDLIAGVIAWLPRAFVAIVIVVVAAAIASAVKDIVGGALGGLSYGRVLATIAYVFLLGLGAIAALNQIGVATTVTTPVLVAVLATVGGILVVGVGGGLIRPMQSRWEAWLTRAEQESHSIATHARAYRADRRAATADAPPSPATADAPPIPAVADEPLSPAGADPDATGVTRPADPDTTQVVTRPADPEATQVVTRPADPEDTTQVVPRADDPDVTQPTPTGGTSIPGQRSTDDSETTMVIPPAPPRPDQH